VAINLKSPEGKEMFFKLMGEADVFVTNTRPAALKRLGIAYEDVKERFPGLVYAIVLGYGLCSNAVIGLTGRSLPLIVPRTDDCMALFLGSQACYLKHFEEHSGTYWLNNGWVEASRVPTMQEIESHREALIEKYGEDNAEFLIEQELLWTKNYKSCGFIDSPLYHNEEYCDLARRFAADFGWSFFRVDGDSRMIDGICRGEFPVEEYLICPPGYRVAESFDALKVRAEKM
jgi:hypothetical protein